MAAYTARLLHAEDYTTTAWSGGTTTELSIAPEGSVYADRDFLWRLSSATVDLEESTFTSLPDYNRIILTLQGGIRLSHNGGAWIELPELTAHSFDGADETKSVGKVIDFNLMMRKGRCTGEVVTARAAAGEERRLEQSFKEPVAVYDTVAAYCAQGTLDVTLETGETFRMEKGAMLKLTGAFDGAVWTCRAGEDAAYVLAAVRTV